eukprot:2069568-Rhodomonas_salina.1
MKSNLGTHARWPSVIATRRTPCEPLDAHRVRTVSTEEHVSTAALAPVPQHRDRALRLPFVTVA